VGSFRRKGDRMEVVTELGREIRSFDPRSALLAQNRLFGEGRHDPGWSDRGLEPTAVSALAASSLRSAVGAARLDSDGGRGAEVVGLFRDRHPRLSRSLGAGSTRVPMELCRFGGDGGLVDCPSPTALLIRHKHDEHSPRLLAIRSTA
jgi:hypothetical protein